MVETPSPLKVAPLKMSVVCYIAELKKLQFGFDRSISEIAEQLEQFENLLIKWQKVQNLVSRETLIEIWPRHFLDSLQLFPLIDGDQLNIVDMGSGGGFPSIPLAIAIGSGKHSFHLVESNRRKASFLRTISRELGLGLHVHGQRVEEIEKDLIGDVDLVTSRATSSLVQLLQMAEPLWGDTTRALFHKGLDFSEELTQASTIWDFDVLSVPSITSDKGVILDITRLQKRPV